jgi:hypothetical protein
MEKILKKYIQDFLKKEHPSIKNYEDVIFESVSYALADVMQLGHIPYRFLEITAEFLQEEAWDILRRVTYGSLTLEEYRILSHVKRAEKKKKIH